MMKKKEKVLKNYCIPIRYYIYYILTNLKKKNYLFEKSYDNLIDIIIVY